jgi:predicted dehydrogenase
VIPITVANGYSWQLDAGTSTGEPMHNLETAVVGFGLAGRYFHAPVIRNVLGMSLAAVVTTKPRLELPELSRETRLAPEIDEVLSDPRIQLVVIATPNDTHASLARKALLAGKHVVVDKPFATSYAEAEALTELAAERKRQLVVFHNRRFDSDFMTLKSLRDSGQLGDIVEMHSSFDRFRPDVSPRWREEPGPGSGLWFDLGPHLLDQALHLFGRPHDMQADIGIQRVNAKVDDYFSVTLRYDRLRVHLHASSLASWADERFVVHGTKASYVKHGVDTQENALRAGRTPGDATWGHDAHPGALVFVRNGAHVRKPVPGIPGDYRLFYSGVRDAIVKGTPPPVAADEALLVMRLLEDGKRMSPTPASTSASDDIGAPKSQHSPNAAPIAPRSTVSRA